MSLLSEVTAIQQELPSVITRDRQVVSRESIRTCLVLTILLGLTYASTIFLPYALNDENWIIRASNWWARLDVRQGRPLFSIVIFLTSKLRDGVGAMVIPLLRAGAIVGIAIAMTMIARWMERWHCSRASSVLVVLTVASLPPYQVYVADATWIVLPFLAAITATITLSSAYDRMGEPDSKLRSYGAAAGLMFFSLAFYQPAVLISVGLQIVPVLTVDVRDSTSVRARVKFVAFVIAFVAIVTLVYYLTWLYLWRLLESTTGAAYYSPFAVNRHPFKRLVYFFSDRLLQVLNLWYVDALRPTPYAAVMASAILVGGAADFLRTRGNSAGRGSARNWLLKYGCVVAILIASDAIPLMAAAPIPSYVTAPALAFVVTFWALQSVFRLSPDGLGIIREPTIYLLGVGVFGLFMAEYTTLTYFSVPVSLEYGLIKGEVVEFLKTHQAVHHVHVVGRKTPLLNHGLHEFGWSNATFDVYARDMVKNVLDDVGVPADIDVTASGTLATALAPAQVPQPEEALVIDLSRIHVVR